MTNAKYARLRNKKINFNTIFKTMNNLLFLADPASASFDLIEFLTGPSFLSALKSFALALVVWIIGSVVINRMSILLQKYFVRIKMDESLRPFLLSLISVLLKVMLLLAVASTLGMDVMSFVAIFSAGAFAVGMALQGGLSNFAGGVMILLFKPFRVNDLITAQGFNGTVQEIQVFNTILLTLDNEVVILPNGPLSNGSMTNHSTKGKRGCTVTFGIAHDADIDRAKEVIMKVAKSCEHLVELEKSSVVVSELSESATKLTIRVWTHPDNWWDVYFYMNEYVKKEFGKEKLGVPYNVMAVNLINKNN